MIEKKLLDIYIFLEKYVHYTSTLRIIWILSSMTSINFHSAINFLLHTDIFEK